MSSSNIQTIFGLIKVSLGVLSINLFVDFKDLNVFSKIHRFFNIINVVFFYFMAFAYTFLYNIRNPDENRMAEQFVVSIGIIGIINPIIRILLSFYLKNKYVAIFKWIINVHKQHQDQALQSYVGTKFEDLGIRFVKIWK